MEHEVCAEKNKITLLWPALIVIICGIMSSFVDDYILDIYNKIYGFIICICTLIFIIELIRILTTKLSFDNKKIYGKTGLINILSLESPINKINDIFIHKGLLGLIFNYSMIIVSTSSNKYKFYYIKNADIFRKILLDKIDSYNR